MEQQSCTEGPWKNRYFVMRHGESTANVDGVIVSRPGLEACERVGLTPLGQVQASSAAHGCRLGNDVLIFTSDFARARQTADIVADVLGAAAPVLDLRLRERSFGPYEGTSVENYEQVWADDANNKSQHSVEPALLVLERTLELVSDLESQFSGRTILLVAHGDTLQILQTVAAGLSPGAHRSLPALSNAEIRPLAMSSNQAQQQAATPAERG